MMVPNSPPAQRRVRAAVVGVLLFVLALVVWRNAWLGDDAYVSFRAAENLIEGYGLRWNVAERVQAFTNPLWTLLVASAALFTREFYYTPLVLGLVATLGAAVLVVRQAAGAWAAAAGVALLIASRAFVDYSTSGLENALGHLLLAGFLVVVLRGAPAGRWLFLASVLAALLMVNRMDMLLIVAPVLVWSVVRSPARGPALVTVALGMTPFVAWVLFAVIYYGFPFPNTAYAKLGAGVPVADVWAQGFRYVVNFVQQDTLAFATLVAGVAAAAWSRRAMPIAVAAGAVAYVVYVVSVGGDFMRGRFFTLPFLAAVVLLVHVGGELRPRWSVAVLSVAVGWSLLVPSSPLRTDPGHYADVADGERFLDGHGIADERSFYFRGTSPALAGDRARKPVHEWADWGRRARDQGATGIALVSAAGMRAFFAGPRVHVIDRYGLGDPLMARLPPDPARPWRIGHIHREPPEGYRETLRSGVNQMRDDALVELVTILHRITREPIWSAERWRAIWDFNTGRYDRLVEIVGARHVERRRLVERRNRD
jgi:arabinofuranosyltransferase